MKFFYRRTVAALLLLVALAPLCRAQNNQDLLRRLPDSTNALVIVDVTGLRKALGVAPGTTLRSADIGTLPITASRFVLGANINLSQREHISSIAMAQLERKMSVQDIAKAENEQAEKIGDLAFVASPRNAYFVELGPDLLACYSPANRQQLVRWVSFQKNNQLSALPEYLIQAANPSEPALMIMSASLAGSVDPAAIRRGVNNSKVMASRRNADYDAVSKTLDQVQGVTLTIRAGNPLEAELTVDFAVNTEAIRPFGKSLLLEGLQHAGVYVPDFDTWQPRLKEKSIGLYGPLSFNSLRKFGTLITTPVPPAEAADMASYQSMDPSQRAIAASKRYFQGVTQHLTDLRGEKSKSWKGLANWYDQYANQISNLPSLNVDPQLLAYAGATAEHLRSVSSSLKGVASERGQLHYNSYYGYTGSYVQGYGGQVTQAQVQYSLGAQAEGTRTKLWEQIDNETAQVRQEMTQKYQTQF